ncbi:MAG TPA: methionine--tRNA ligase [Candidatus Paceibacterota bacterium]|jgi:methionyl-tRNA synthetase
MKKPFYITTPIFYPNGFLHMGHAYVTTLCDVLARYHRLSGDQTYFLTGADENTEKVVRAAKAVGKDPKIYLDEIVKSFRDLFDSFEISYDQFIRTSDEKVHWPGAQEVWKRLVASGDIEKRSYEGLYCQGHEAFVTEKDLVDGKCPDHGEAPVLLREENYFFKLSKYTKQVKDKIEKGEIEIVPQSRRNEILALLERGLEDVSFSRPADKMSVGIPVPGDPSQKIYVWCDALVNYISALGFGRADQTLFDTFWSGVTHVIGKDILRFHAAIWPAMLMSAGLPVPRRILVHGLIISGGKKMSKSLGNVIDPLALSHEYGVEPVRYYLARYISPFEDGEMTLDSFKSAYNADLANGLGNLVSRVMRMASTHLSASANVSTVSIPAEYAAAFERFDIQAAAGVITKAIAEADQTIQEKAPFKLVKTDKEAAVKIIANLCTRLFAIGKMLEPIMPQTAVTIQTLVRENKMPDAPLFLRKE